MNLKSELGWPCKAFLVAVLAGCLSACATSPDSSAPSPEVRVDLLVFPPTSRVASGDIKPGTAAGQVHLRAGWPFRESDTLHKSGVIPKSEGLKAESEYAQVQFYLLLPTELTLVGSYRYQGDNRMKVGLSCNGLPVDGFVLAPETDSFRVSLPSEVLRPGVNEFQLHIPKRALEHTLWRSFSLSARARLATPKGDRLLVPAGSRTDFYFPAPRHLKFQAQIQSLDAEDQFGLELVTPTFTRQFQIGEQGETVLDLGPATENEPCRLTLLGGKADAELIAPAVLAEAGRADAEPSPQLRPESRPPLILLICMDTLRADAMGCYGNEPSPTPCLDQLDWPVFDHAQAQSGWTKSSTASVLTGRTVLQHGVLSYEDKISDKDVTLVEALRSAGYKTFGLTANRWTDGAFGFSQGFDHYELVEHKAPAEMLVNRAIQQLDATDAPLFMYLHLMDPHTPYDPPPPFRPKTFLVAGGADKNVAYLAILMARGYALDKELLGECRALYEGDIKYADQQLGRLLEQIKARGLYEDALIVFFSDHGEEFGEHGRTLHGNSLYQELLRIPLLLKPPKGSARTPRLDLAAEQIDIMPTILGYAQASVPDLVEGIDLAGAGSDRPEYRVALSYLEWGTARWHQIYEAASGHGYKLHVRRADTLSPRMPVLELFDTFKDPGERQDLSHLGLVQMGFLWARLEAEKRRAKKGEKASPEEMKDALRSLPYLH